MAHSVVLGDCRDVLKTLEECSLDSLVTDPPAGISFMGKRWDSYESLRHFQLELQEVFTDCLRVLKPGSHGLVWALPKTAHYTAMALTDAGFETRDMVLHLFGSGMPKAQDVSRAGAGDAWEGWGTALKPAHEVWWLVRKPLLEPTVVKQVLGTGTGALNIDGCRVPTDDSLGGGPKARPHDMSNACGGAEWDRPWMHDESRREHYAREAARKIDKSEALGRWPANLVLSHAAECEAACVPGCPVAVLDEQLKGCARFFYTAKVSSGERLLRDGTVNRHPTVKPVQLMRYLVRLVTPPRGVVLDPFAGSGSTGCAALREGFGFVGIERDREYARVAQLRLDQEWDTFDLLDELRD